MSASASDARAGVEAWRSRHADQPDHMRLRLIDALSARAQGHDGEVRRILERRLLELLDAHAADLDKAASSGGGAGAAAPAPARGPLAELLAHISAGHAGAPDEPPAAGDPAPAPAFPELPALDEFRRIWSTTRSDSQLRQSLQQAPPANAGPLNSATLAHRAIVLMRELSPGYLQHFLSYVDALSWLEQLGGGAMATRDAPATASSRKRVRGKPRKPRA